MNKHQSNKIKENSNTVRHLIMGQITTTQNLVAIKEVRHAGQLTISWRCCYDRRHHHFDHNHYYHDHHHHLPSISSLLQSIITLHHIGSSWWIVMTAIIVVLCWPIIMSYDIHLHSSTLITYRSMNEQSIQDRKMFDNWSIVNRSLIDQWSMRP